MESIPIRGESRDETGQMHPRMNALIQVKDDKSLHTNGVQHVHSLNFGANVSISRTGPQLGSRYAMTAFPTGWLHIIVETLLHSLIALINFLKHDSSSANYRCSSYVEI